MKKLFPLFISWCLVLQLSAQLSPQIDSIPMRDGKKLLADVYIPSGVTTGPVILVQTPYNRALYRLSLPLQIGLNLNSSNYIFVIVDWRGFYGSAAAATLQPDYGKDGYDVVEWIAQQSWCNGKIGTWGPSALGRVQFQTAKYNPPHLTCICPLVAGPQYEYQEYYPNGVLRTEYVEQLNGLGFGLQPLLMAHQLHDITWTFTENANFYPDSIRVPCYMIGGWYDHTVPQMLPFFAALQTQSPPAVRSQHRLLMGPWVHGGHGSAQVGSANQGQLTYDNAAHWSDSLALKFFDFYLRLQVSNGFNQSPVVQYYQMGDNTWQNFTAWPPTGAVSTNFYLHADGTMDNTIPPGATDNLNFLYDPNSPSPTVGGPTLRADLQQGPYDQAPLVESRNDLLTFTTNTLTQNVVMKGKATAHLKVSSDRYDTDFDIRITDVYPDGRSMLVKDGAYRMRYLNGFSASDTAPIIPGQVYDCNITTSDAAITFLTGHKIRVDVTSSNYPRFNRNMNNDGVQYPGNSLDSVLNPLVAQNTIYLGSDHPSYLELPLFSYVPSGNDVVQPQLRINVYPNPAGNQVTVTLPENTNGNLQLLDLLGNQVTTQTITNSTMVLNTSQLPSGIYLIKVDTQNDSAIKKLNILR